MGMESGVNPVRNSSRFDPSTTQGRESHEARDRAARNRAGHQTPRELFRDLIPPQGNGHYFKRGER